MSESFSHAHTIIESFRRHGGQIPEAKLYEPLKGRGLRHGLLRREGTMIVLDEDKAKRIEREAE